MIDGEDEALELANELEEQPEEGEQQQAPAPEDDELVIEIEGEDSAEEPDLVKHLRTVARDAQREAAELRKAIVPAEIVVGKKPDLWEDSDINGDVDKYDAALLAWTKRGEAAEKQKTEAATKNQAVQKVFQVAYAGYQAKSAALGVTDFKDAENTVVSALPLTVQSAIIQYAQDSAKLVLALGRNPGALAKVAAEPDEMKQILMVMDMEKRMTVNRKKPPAPEADTIQRGSVSVAAPAKDAQAEKLLNAAMKPGGSLTEYNRYMKARAGK